MAAAQIFAPRAPIERQKSGTLDYTDGYTRKMLAWRDDVVRQGAAELQAARDLQNIQTLIGLLDGTGWWESNRPEYRSSFFDNVLSDVRRESLASLSDVKPTIDIGCNVELYKHQAKIVHGIIKHSWVNDAQDLRLVDWIDHALFGTGFLKIVAYAPGVMRTVAKALGQVIPIQMEGGDFQSAQVVIDREYKSLAYFLEVFRLDAERVQKLSRYSVSLQSTLGSERYDRPDNIPEYQWNSLSPTMKRRMYLNRVAGKPQRGYPGTENAAYPVLELQEIYHRDINTNEYGHPVLMKHPDLKVSEHNWHYIVPPKAMLFPRKRLTIFGGDELMFDGPNPFWDGNYPYAMLQLNPCVWSMGGISKYRDLVPLARSQNRIGAGVEETVIDAVNRNVVTRKGAIDPISWERFDPSKPKQKIMLNGTADPSRDWKYMDAKQLPPYVEMWLRYIDSAIKRRSGMLDIQGLARKKQAPGSDTVQSMQDAMSGPYRLESRYVEEAIRQAAILETSRVFQFWTVDQRLRILGPDGMSFEDFMYIASNMVPGMAPKEDWWQQFPINVAQGSMHGSTEVKKQVIAMNLYKAHGISLHGLYEILNIGLDADEQIALIKKEMEQLPQPAPKGRQERTSRSQRNGSPI